MTEPTPAAPRSVALVPGAIEQDSALVRTRVTCALLFFAARYVPVPLLDDVLRAQVAAYMVKHSVRRAGLTVPSEQLAPFYEKDEHWAIGCFWWMFKLPFRILLFPIRKLANVLFAVGGGCLVAAVVSLVLDLTSSDDDASEPEASRVMRGEVARW
jgi:hypothetical protein